MPDAQAVYIDTLGTYSPSLPQSLLPPNPPSDLAILDRINLMTALDMVTLIEACQTIGRSLSRLIPIELLIIDTIANPISLVINKGQLQGFTASSQLTGRSCFDAILLRSPSSDNNAI